MKLIILGSGTSVPLPYRASPSLALFTGDNPVLFDMGPGSLRQLARIGINHKRIEQIFISHFHPDHTADLIHLLFATRNPEILDKRKPFTITGPMGLKAFLKNLRSPYGRWLDIPDEIMTLEELDISKPEKSSYLNYDVLSQPIGHTPNSLAYRVHGKEGKSFVYSGDTAFCDEIVDLARNCDLLILDCSFPEGGGMEGHLTPSQAGLVATLADVKKLLLIHFYPEVLRTDIAGDCRKTYKGELILGRDMLHISL
ncbi:MBL fold metallo-hydrolase [Deltaproteobacteria bacterium]|nr:MBL fold metallo-hydrolase [Deltaproteobacteria bacterium]